MENIEKIKAAIAENETILPDNHPVHGDYLYVCDGKVIRCDLIRGTVLSLKHDLRNFYKLEAKEIRRCDIVNRRKLIELTETEVSKNDTNHERKK